jgi:hypothetical protein
LALEAVTQAVVKFKNSEMSQELAELTALFEKAVSDKLTKSDGW